MRTNGDGAMAGIAAGAVGTAMLNLATYLDMAIRGRPPSQVPAEVAGKLTEEAGIDLGDGDRRPTSGEQAAEGQERAEQEASNRRQAIGQLLGYGTGLGVGLAYGLLRRRFRPPLALAALALSAAAMAGSDAPATALGVTDPRRWDTSAWAADVFPHLVYGFATALAYESISR